MSEAYNRAVDGLPVADGVGSCGTAAFRGSAWWSRTFSATPTGRAIRIWCGGGSAGLLVGTHPLVPGAGAGNLCHLQALPSAPTAAEIECIEGAANMAAIALEHGEALAELERQARTDYLTGLDNRRSFWAKGRPNSPAPSAMAANCRSSCWMSITSSTSMTPMATRSATGCCRPWPIPAARSCARSTGRAAGGEEFGVLLPETSGSQALEVAERLREAFADAPVGLPDGRSVSYTVSIGVTSLLSGQHADLDILFAQADHALYAAKDAGRNRVCTHRPGGAVQ